MKIFRIEGRCESTIRDNDEIVVGCVVIADNTEEAIKALNENYVSNMLKKQRGWKNITVREIKIEPPEIFEWDSITFSLIKY